MTIQHLIISFLFLITSCTSREQQVDINKLLGNDYRLFQNTQAWTLAKAVEDEDQTLIKKIVNEKQADVDFKDKRFGQTLLMLAVTNQQYNSCKTLLELGADPNKYDRYDGSNAMIEAAQVSNITGDNTKFLKLLLQFKGNPNFVEVGPRREGNSTRNSVLISAVEFNEVQSSLPMVKLLVEAGADVNYKNEFGQTALKQAIILDVYDVALYLLQNGADYNEEIVDRGKYSTDGKKIYLVDMLREFTPELNSKKHKEKLEMIKFLKQKGIDYNAVPIPDFVLEKIKRDYPKNWEEYIEQY